MIPPPNAKQLPTETTEDRIIVALAMHMHEFIEAHDKHSLKERELVINKLIYHLRLIRATFPPEYFLTHPLACEVLALADETFNRLIRNYIPIFPEFKQPPLA